MAATQRKRYMNRMVTSSVYACAEMAAEAVEQDGADATTLWKLEKFAKGAKQHTILIPG